MYFQIISDFRMSFARFISSLTKYEEENWLKVPHCQWHSEMGFILKPFSVGPGESDSFENTCQDATLNSVGSVHVALGIMISSNP